MVGFQEEKAEASRLLKAKALIGTTSLLPHSVGSLRREEWQSHFQGVGGGNATATFESDLHTS